MKRLKTALVMLAIILVMSCTAENTASIRLSTDGELPVAYEMTDASGAVHRGTVTRSNPVEVRSLVPGDVAITYHGTAFQSGRVAVATAGKDSDVMLTQGKPVPQSVFSLTRSPNVSRTLTSDVLYAYGEYSFYIFNEDGTGWKTTITIDADAMRSKPVSVAIGWKTDGSGIIISDDGKTTVHMSMKGDALLSGSLRWERISNGESGERSLEGVWNILDMGSLENGRPSPLTLQLSLREGKVRVLASADAYGIPMENVTSKVRADMELDVTDILSSLKLDLEKLGRGTSFSSDGSLAVIEISSTLRIPLFRGNAEKEISLWSATTPAGDRKLTLSDIIDYADGMKLQLDDGRTISVSDLLAVTDNVVSASGKTIDISGSWKVGSEVWTTANSISVSDEGRVVVHVPERSGFQVIEIVVPAEESLGLIYHGYCNVEMDGDSLTFAGRNVGNARLLERTPKTLRSTADEALKLIYKDENVDSRNFTLEIREGKLMVSGPKHGESLLSSATVEDGKIGFRHELDSKRVWEILARFGIEKVISSNTALSYDLVFPLAADGRIEILVVRDSTIAI